MSTFVLVHGAWHGGWCWKKVAPILRRAGHDVFTPTMTGLGERVHLRGPGIGLDTHVQDIINVLEYEDLNNVVLVGHSYGGMVVTGVAGRTAERLAHIVYLDAHVPADGQSVIDLLGFTRPGYETEQWVDPPGTFGVKDEVDLAWVQAKMTPHPTRSMRQPVALPIPLEDLPVQRTYVLAELEPLGAWFADNAAKYETDPRWHFVRMQAVHDMMVTEPEQTAAILLKAAEA
jgi:pimeloyl-ACP methyl ester carboxylesterase